jgi:SM-20-related protein
MELLEAAVERMLAEDIAVVDGWIPDATLEGLARRLADLEDSGALAPAGIGAGSGSAVHAEVRSDLTQWWEDEPVAAPERAYLDAVRALSAHINRICFAGIRSEEIHYASYPKGAFYRRHLDRFRTDSARKISLITYLNRGWDAERDGGELVAYTDAGAVRVAPIWGRTVFFRSDVLEHEVLPAGRTRRSVTGWLR